MLCVLKQEKYMRQPPIGLVPRNIWERNNINARLDEIGRVMSEYYDARLEIRIKWIEEYNELIERLHYLKKEDIE